MSSSLHVANFRLVLWFCNVASSRVRLQVSLFKMFQLRHVPELLLFRQKRKNPQIIASDAGILYGRKFLKKLRRWIFLAHGMKISFSNAFRQPPAKTYVILLELCEINSNRNDTSKSIHASAIFQCKRFWKATLWKVLRHLLSIHTL